MENALSVQHRDMSRIVCYSCGKKGHMSSSCPESWTSSWKNKDYHREKANLTQEDEEKLNVVLENGKERKSYIL